MSMAKPIIIGGRYGKLIVLQKLPRSYFLCRCDCATEKPVRSDHLRTGGAQSCGCAKMEQMRAGLRTIHGNATRTGKTKEWATWSRMIQRCFDLKNKNYARYGGRGITVCAEWRHSFPAFLSHIGKAPSPLHSIERINYDGNYEPGNCRWATKREQANNRSTNHFFTLNGLKLSAMEWARRTGIDSMTLIARAKRGWNDEQTLTTPLYV